MRMSVTSPACSKKLRTVSSVALQGMFLMKIVDEPPPPPGVEAAGVAAPVSVFTFFAGLASSCYESQMSCQPMEDHWTQQSVASDHVYIGCPTLRSQH